MAWTVREGTTVHYRDAQADVFHAIVTDVTDPDTIDLRAGNGATKLTVTGAARTASHFGAGWYRHGSDLQHPVLGSFVGSLGPLSAALVGTGTTP